MRIDRPVTRHAWKGEAIHLIQDAELPVAVGPSRPLDLTGLNSTAALQPTDLVLALWLLSVPRPPSTVVLPSSLRVRRRLGRAGLVFAAARREVSMEIDGRSVSVPEALGVGVVDMPLSIESYDLETSDRMRVVSNLEDRRPPGADIYGRRHYWIDGLGVAVGHSKRECFDSHADQCFFEMADNVFRWSNATSTVAVVSATFGGGERSHNRLQVVAVDNGIGIIESARRKARVLTAMGQQQLSLSDTNEDKADKESAADLISNLLAKAYEERYLAGTQGGHGLNTITQHVSRWNGTMNVISSFADSRVIHRGRRNSDGKWRTSAYSVAGISGTVVHLTLNAISQDVEMPSRTRDGELVSV